MKSQILVDGLCFGEGPRWHDGRLWLSDMHDHWVINVAGDGTIERVVEVPEQPSGLGWRPDGELLIVSMTDRRVLGWDGATLREVADLSQLASFHCNDMVVDAAGRAYVGNFGFDLNARAEPTMAELVMVDERDEARVAATELAFPNGSVVSADGRTLVVAETYAGKLTAFDVAADGSLSNRRVWAQLPQGAVPDGICLDEANSIWVASPTSNECLRIEEGGAVSHRVEVDQGAYACMLGGPDGTTLHILTAPSSDPQECMARRGGRVEIVEAPYPRAGLP